MANPVEFPARPLGAEEEFEARVLRYLDRETTPDEEVRVCEELRTSAARRDLFASLARQRGELFEVLNAERSRAAEETGAPKAAPTPRRGVRHIRIGGRSRGLRTAGILAAAAVLIAVALYVALSGKQESSPAPRGERVARPPAPERRKPEGPRMAPPPAPAPTPERPEPPEPEKPKPPEAPKPAPPEPRPEPPRPEPKPAPLKPEPVPEPEKPVPPKETRVALARLQRMEGQVFVVSDSGRSAAQAGQNIFPKQRLATSGHDGLAVLLAGDATRFELGADASATFEGPGQVYLSEGEITVDIPVSGKERGVTVSTANAEARALGTRFTVTRRQEATHLEVEAGAVRFTRLHDDQSIDVRDGFQAVAAKAMTLSPRRFLGPNLLADPGFERNEPAWVKNDPALAPVKAPAHSGTRALQLPLTFQKDLACSQTIPSAAGATYHATAWVRIGEKAGKGAVTVFIQWRDARGGAIRTDRIGRAAGAQEWTRLGGRASAPANAAAVQLFIMAEGDPGGSGAAWVDDVSLRRRQ